MKFKHTLKCAVAALVLVAAAACRPGAEAPSDDSAPTSVVQAPDAPPAPAAAPPSPTDGQSEEVASARKWEAKWLKDFPEAAKREGGVLTLFTGGTPVASFTDTSSPSTLSAIWAFSGALKAPGPTGERLFFRVTEFWSDEEGRTEWFEHWFDPAGRFIPSHDVLDQYPGGDFIPSNGVFGQNPGRTMIAAGFYESGDLGLGPDLSLMDWSGEPELVYEFKSPCYPVKWISDDELEAACPYAYTGNTPEAAEITPARVLRAGPREWRLQQTGLPTRHMPNPPQTAPYDETVTAAEIAPDPDLEAALSELGYQQLDRPAAPTRPVAEPATTPSASSRKKGDVFSDCTGCPSMVVVPAGSFTMGSPSTETDRSEDEGPQRTVTIGSDFAVGRYEVRWAEWDACVADGGCSSAGPDLAGGDNGWGKSNRPVIEVDWNDAQAYVSWLSRKSGQRYRLLSEAEWEYAARAGNPARWSFGDDETRLGSFGWYSSNSNSQTQPVGRKAANAFGLHDMHGNVWEWTQDCWNESYTGAPKDGSAWTSGNCSRRVVRGGSWDDIPQNLRSANRNGGSTTYRDNYIGFRVARTL